MKETYIPNTEIVRPEYLFDQSGNISGAYNATLESLGHTFQSSVYFTRVNQIPHECVAILQDAVCKIQTHAMQNLIGLAIGLGIIMIGLAMYILMMNTEHEDYKEKAFLFKFMMFILSVVNVGIILAVYIVPIIF